MEHTIDINNIPSIPDKDFAEKIEQYITQCIQTIRSFLIFNKTVVFVILIVVISIIVTLFIVFKKPEEKSPCLLYNSETLAKDVSISCLQKLWSINCASRSSYTFSSSYTGFWLQSPQNTIVRCNSQYQGVNCGIGTYGNIVIYIQFCNPYLFS